MHDVLLCVLALVLQVIGLLVGFVTDRFLYAFVVFGAGVALTILVRAHIHKRVQASIAHASSLLSLSADWPQLAVPQQAPSQVATEQHRAKRQGAVVRCVWHQLSSSLRSVPSLSLSRLDKMVVLHRSVTQAILRLPSSTVLQYPSQPAIGFDRLVLVLIDWF